MENQISEEYFALLENALCKGRAIELWERACAVYESGIFDEDGDLAAFIDLAEEVIANWTINCN